MIGQSVRAYKDSLRGGKNMVLNHIAPVKFQRMQRFGGSFWKREQEACSLHKSGILEVLHTVLPGKLRGVSRSYHHTIQSTTQMTSTCSLTESWMLVKWFWPLRGAQSVFWCILLMPLISKAMTAVEEQCEEGPADSNLETQPVVFTKDSSSSTPKLKTLDIFGFSTLPNTS